MEQSNKNVITYEKVKNEIKNINLADMTKEQVFDRYIAYGKREELNNPEIQKVLIQKGYTNELMDMVTIITDDEVIKMLYQSKAFENYNKLGIRLYHGKLLEMKVEKNDDIFNLNYEFLEHKKMGRHFSGDIASSEDEINQIKTEIEPYKDKLIAVCDFSSQRKSSEKYHLKSFLKEIIDIEEYITKCQYKLEDANNAMESVCNRRLKEIYGQEIPKQIQPKSLEELCTIYGLTKSTFDHEEGKAYNIKYSEQWDEYQKIMKKHNIDSTYIEKCKKIKYLFPKSNNLNSVVYLIKHIAYMAYYPEITEKVISKAPRLF